MVVLDPGGTLEGRWRSRGPDNQPGCWEMAAVHSPTDTIYGVTCGHYGGYQFIHRGTLAGDDFEIISGHFPQRYDDLLVIDRAGSRRLVAGLQAASVVYSDDEGSTWHDSDGVPAVVSSTVRRGSDGAIFAASPRAVHVSRDDGDSFAIVQSFAEDAAAELWSPTDPAQSGRDTVYLLRGAEFWRLGPDDSQFLARGRLSAADPNARRALGGDARRMYVAVGEAFHTSEDEGTTWQPRAGSMFPGHTVAVHPEDPNIVHGGYLNPTISWDAMATTTERNVWGQHQIHPADSPEDRHRHYLHADNQSTQFFRDSSGALFLLRSSDGGLYLSRREWEASLPSSGSYPKDVYRNLNLIGAASTEVYPSAAVTGARDPSHLVLGTQDQGTQTVHVPGPAALRSFQGPYGDGPHIVSAHGEWGWTFTYTADRVYAPYPLYDGLGQFQGVKGRRDEPSIELSLGAWYFHDAWVDLQAPQERMWLASRQLARIEWDGESLSVSTDALGEQSDYIGTVTQAPSDPNFVVAVRGGQVFRSRDRGLTWDEGVATKIQSPGGWDRCGSWISPEDSQLLLIACPSATETVAVLSTDGGEAWTDVSPGLPNTDIGGFVGTPDARFVFASTRLGAHAFDVAARRWVDLTVPGVPVFDGRRPAWIPQTSAIRFSTWGSGIWDFEVDGCEDAFALSIAAQNDHASATPACRDACAMRDEATFTGHWWPSGASSNCECCPADVGDDESTDSGESGATSTDEGDESGAESDSEDGSSESSDGSGETESAGDETGDETTGSESTDEDSTSDTAESDSEATDEGSSEVETGSDDSSEAEDSDESTNESDNDTDASNSEGEGTSGSTDGTDSADDEQNETEGGSESESDPDDGVGPESSASSGADETGLDGGADASSTHEGSNPPVFDDELGGCNCASRALRPTRGPAGGPLVWGVILAALRGRRRLRFALR